MGAMHIFSNRKRKVHDVTSGILKEGMAWKSEVKHAIFNLVNGKITLHPFLRYLEIC